MNEVRIFMEQEYLPALLFGDKEKRKALLSGLQNKENGLLFYLYNAIYNQNGWQCPYREDQFNAKFCLAAAEGCDPAFMVLTIDMPEPEEMMLASRVFICADASMDNPCYFLVEKSIGSYGALCRIDGDGTHFNYGPAPESEEEQFQKVCDIYDGYLKRRAKKS